MKSPISILSFLLASSSLASAYAIPGSPDSDGNVTPCVARSPTTGLYYDLNSLTVPLPPSDEKSRKYAREESWHVKGYDYGANFTLNICGPVIEEVTDVVGVEENMWQNVSAYYQKDDKTYSIGQQASDPFFRGRKLLMNYTDGSPCDGEFIEKSSHNKSTMLSFLCDRDITASTPLISFVGTMDQCTYVFEVRSAAACGGYSNDSAGQGLSPGGIFGVIALIAVAAYLIGGCAYQRTVMHQRGWRQCPNFSLWAGIVDFLKLTHVMSGPVIANFLPDREQIQDMTIILFSSLGRMFRFKRFQPAYASAGATQRGRFSDSHRGRTEDLDAENRLIDQLDEEWDD